MDSSTKNQIIEMRENGNTYSEIKMKLGIHIPKGTISYICKNVQLPKGYKEKVKLINEKNLSIARRKALQVNQEKQRELLQNFYIKNIGLKKLIDKDISKLLLACLYLAEGGKTQKGSIMFGNSDKHIISFFLKLLREAYSIDEKKFRCTLQCRGDQDIRVLENFWSAVTQIPLKQFYKAQIDSRTLGKKTNKVEYKGVCRIDYFSANIFHELNIIGKIITE
ncbi:MAG: hypothetical protein WCW16_02445 [Candidatus Magasanikbacteria bacterium]